MRSYADVTPLDQENLWNHYIPRGEVTLLIGDSGIGKDFLMCDLAARVTRGDVMPDGTPGTPAGHVLQFNPEDNPQTTTVHRLMAARAELAKVHDETVVNGTLWQCDAEGYAHLRACNAELGGAKLATISALGAVVPVGLTAEVPVRQKIMNPLQAVARDTGMSILIVVHLTKDGAAKVAKDPKSAKDGAGGSKGLTSAARQILVVTRDKNDPRIRTLMVVKSSNDDDSLRPQRYTLIGNRDDHSTRVQWLASVDDLGDVESEEAGETALLAQLLLAGPGQLTDAQALAVAAGIDYGTARILLRRMTVQGLVTEHRGRYAVAMPEENTEQEEAK